MIIADRQALALEYLNLATDGDRGRHEGDDIYIAVTEGRDHGKAYSSCGDLAHWLLYRLGVRTSYVNRAEHRGWRNGQNISWLAFGPIARKPTAVDQYFTGDILLIWNREDGTDAHALVVRNHNDVELLTAEYGQPGGASRRRTLLDGKVGTRKVQRVIPFEDVLRHANDSGKLIEPQPIAAWLATATPGPSSHPLIRRGTRSAYVMKAQAILSVMIDGDFGSRTEQAVRAFQSRSGLPTTGVVDVATWAALLHKVPR